MELKEIVTKLIEQGKKELEEGRERAARDLDWKLESAKSKIEAFQNLMGEMPASILELLEASEGRLWARTVKRGNMNNNIPRQCLSSLSLTLDHYQMIQAYEQPLVKEDEDFQILLVILPLKKNQNSA